MRVEMYHERVGRGYLIGVYEVKDDDTNKLLYGLGNKHDIVLSYGGRQICNMSTGCYGEKAVEYWYRYHIKIMHRIMFLLDSKDKAYTNLLTYSSSYMMDKPRDGYTDEWNATKDKITMIDEWLNDILSGIGEASELIREEFEIPKPLEES